MLALGQYHPSEHQHLYSLTALSGSTDLVDGGKALENARTRPRWSSRGLGGRMTRFGHILAMAESLLCRVGERR